MDATVKVRLLAPHTHAGDRQLKNAVLTVTLPQQAWLISRGIAVTEKIKPEKHLPTEE